MPARNGNSVRELFVSRVSKEVKLDDLKTYVESKGFTVLNVKGYAKLHFFLPKLHCPYSKNNNLLLAIQIIIIFSFPRSPRKRAYLIMFCAHKMYQFVATSSYCGRYS